MRRIVSEEPGWFAFSPDDVEDLPPDRRAVAEQALAEHAVRKPLATAEVLVFGWERGQCEVRWGGDGCVDGAGQRRVLDAAIAALQEAREIFDDT